jgi:hypothetical protein
MTHTTSRALANFPQLDVELLEGGNIRLEQDYGSGESGIIDLHPCQIRLIAESVGLLPVVDDGEQALKKRLQLIGKRLALVSSRIDAAYEWWEVLPDDTPSGMEGVSHLLALRDLVNICVEDVGGEQATHGDTTAIQRKPNDTSTGVEKPNTKHPLQVQKLIASQANTELFETP